MHESSSAAELDRQYFLSNMIKIYPEYLTLQRMASSKRNIENSTKCMVRADSPLIDVINLLRFQRGAALLRSEEIDGSTQTCVVENAEACAAIQVLPIIFREEFS